MNTGTSKIEFENEARGAALALKWAEESDSTTHRHILNAAVMQLFSTEDYKAQLEVLVDISCAVDAWMLEVGDGLLPEPPDPVCEHEPVEAEGCK